ncbi:MAG TPA: hypothetical protein VHT73_08065 [Thermodesulfobacteriota bacterium]|nr:hypothetical protein [Thermodesulfobacteriota bacterium]
MADCIDYSPMFPHYLKRRIRVAKQELLTAYDELDLFGYYLKEGLYIEDKKDIAPGEFLRLDTYITDFDDYYFHKTVARIKPAPKPHQKMSVEFRPLLNALEETNAESRVEVAMGVLDLRSESRKQLIRMIEKVKKDLSWTEAYTILQ